MVKLWVYSCFIRCGTMEVGMVEEFHSLIHNHTSDLANFPSSKNNCWVQMNFLTWVFNATKHDSLQNVVFDILVLILLRLTLLWFVLGIFKLFYLWQLMKTWRSCNLKSRFLHGAIDKDKYMIQVPRFEHKQFPHQVHHLK